LLRVGVGILREGTPVQLAAPSTATKP
jgi:hypothetical protein